MSNSRLLKAYLAAPLFNPRERDFNNQLERYLSPFLQVYLPQRDGELLTRLVAQGQSVEVAQELVFENDIDAIRTCDIVIAVLDGRTVDEGVAFEVGFARALGKVCIGFKTDDRNMLPTGDNPMIVRGCHYHCSTIDDLIELVKHSIESIVRCRSAEKARPVTHGDKGKVTPI